MTPGDAATPKRDYASAAWSVLPPGENGSLTFNRNTRDQSVLYDGLTVLGGNVTPADIGRYFKPAPLGLGKDRARTRDEPRGGVTVVRDSFGVAHVTGKTEADVAFGAGWVTAEDRGALLQLLRGPARIAALDVPGLDPFEVAFSGRNFVPSREAEAFLSNQVDALRSLGPKGRSILAIMRAYAAGINAWNRLNSVPAAHFTTNDVIALTALVASRFGQNGGREVQNSMFLDALGKRFGPDDARRVFADLRSANDPEAPFTLKNAFPYHLPPATAPGSVVVDDGSFTGVPPTQPPAASNAVLIGAKRSRTGHPIFLGGPQVGYFFPQFFAEMELSGAGFATRGAVFPGVPFVVVGRGPDFAWSATASQADNVDLFVETLCDDDLHYLYRGQCVVMRRVPAGSLRAPRAPDQPVTYYETTHGPVLGYATVGGRRVAISMQRSTRGREIVSAPAFYDLNTARVASAKQFVQTMNGVEFTLNWFYADDRDIAFFSSGRLPRRAPGIDPALPTAGTGEYDWRGFMPFAAHARAVNPASGIIVNWNNRPAPDVGAADSNFAYGPVQRVELLTTELAQEAEAHARQRDLGDEQGGDAGPARGARLAAGARCPPCRARADRARRGGRRARRRVGVRRRKPPRRRPRRPDRRSGRRRSRRRVAGALRRGSRAAPRSAHRPSRRAQPEERRSRAVGIRVRHGLVRVRGQGPADAPRSSGSRRVLASLLRGRGSGCLPRCALGRRRRRSCGARGRSGRRSVSLAGRCDARADPVHVGFVQGLDALDESPDVPAAAHVLRPSPALSGVRTVVRR